MKTCKLFHGEEMENSSSPIVSVWFETWNGYDVAIYIYVYIYMYACVFNVCIIVSACKTNVKMEK